MADERQFIATHSGIIKLGEIEMDAYVLNNGERVMSQRGIIKYLSGGRESGDLQRYLRAQSIKDFLPTRLNEANFQKGVRRFMAGGTSTNGLVSRDIIDFFNSYLKARQLGLLATNQAAIAERAEIFIQASAATGIDGVIDEATGYEFFKKANELQEKLAAYLQEGFREWTLTFPREFFMQLYRLEGTKPPMPLKKFPQRFGRYVMEFVYDTLDPDVADWLRENNQKPAKGHLHWQKFSDVGYKKLQDHLMIVLGVMKSSTSIERVRYGFAIAFPNARTQRALRLHKEKQQAPLEQGQLFKII